MKRDARIGLAVVLVLGLSVTMLIGRALYKRGGSAVDGDGEQFASENSGDGGRSDSSGTPPPANANQSQNQPGFNLLNADQQRLIDEQSRLPDRPNVGGGANTTPPRRNEGTDPSSDLDHESPTPPARNVADADMRPPSITPTRSSAATVRGASPTKSTATESTRRRSSMPTSSVRKK